MNKAAPSLLLAALLSGCGGGQAWLTAEREVIRIEGSDYRVNWLPGPGAREFSFVVGAPIVLFPDIFLQERQSEAAASIVAEKLCRGPARKVSGAYDPATTTVRLVYRCV